MTLSEVRQALSKTGVSAEGDVVPYLQFESHQVVEKVRRTLNDLIRANRGTEGSSAYVFVKELGAAGDGTTDDTAAIQAAMDSAASQKKIVFFGTGTYRVTSTLLYGDDACFEGQGDENTIIAYQGTGFAFAQSSPGTRIFSVQAHKLRVNYAAAADGAWDLTDVSLLLFTSCSAFGTGIGHGTCFYTPGTANGRALYNAFYHCRGLSCERAFHIAGPGSNDALLFDCRSAAATFGVDVLDSNHVMVIAGRWESGGTGIRVNASSNALSDGLTAIANRFEGLTVVNFDVASPNVRHTIRALNHHVTGTPATGTTGTGHVVFGDVGLGLEALNLRSAQVDRPYVFARTSVSDDPALEVVDEASGGGVPTAIRARQERAGGFAFDAFRTADGGVTWSVRADGHNVAASQDVQGQWTLSNSDPTGQIGTGAGLARLQFNKGNATNNSFTLLASGGTASADLDWAHQHQTSGNVAHIRFDGTTGAVVDTPLVEEFSTGQLRLLHHLQRGSVTGLTASTTQTQAAGTAITRDSVEFTTVANAGDAATLPLLVSTGVFLIAVTNSGANSMQVFPGSGDQINALGTNNAISIAAGQTVLFQGVNAALWKTVS